MEDRKTLIKLRDEVEEGTDTLVGFIGTRACSTLNEECKEHLRIIMGLMTDRLNYLNEEIRRHDILFD